ncbi:MAG: hypothetical protein ACE5HT_08435 [Gemmatimonadales bacterium]
MDLVQHVANEFNVDAGQAERGLGWIFTSVRLAIEPEAYRPIKSAFPDSDAWMSRAMAGGRTGEMLALMGAETLEQNLKSTGFSDAQIPALFTTVREALRQHVTQELLDQIADKVTVLQG